jgi:hypothetical protein
MMWTPHISSSSSLAKQQWPTLEHFADFIQFSLLWKMSPIHLSWCATRPSAKLFKKISTSHCVLHPLLSSSGVDGICLASIFKKQEEWDWPPLWSSGQSSWLQIRRPGFDSRQVVGLERGPLSLVSTTEELLDRKVAAPVQENLEYGRRDSSRWPRGTLYPQKLAITSLTSCGRLSCGLLVGIVRSRTQTKEFSLGRMGYRGTETWSHTETGNIAVCFGRNMYWDMQKLQKCDSMLQPQ